MAEEQTESNKETRQPAGDTADTADRGRETARSYSQEDVDRIVKERLARERAKHADYDDVKRKAGEADSLREELDKAKSGSDTLRAKVAQAEHEQHLVGIRSAVAAKYGITDPTVLAVGDDEEWIDAYTQKLMKTFRPYERFDRARSKDASGNAPVDEAKDFGAMAAAGF